MPDAPSPDESTDSLSPDPNASAPPPHRGDARAIGVFDSGVGGLTVLRHLLRQLPDERFVYVADAARAPYGGRWPSEVEMYSRDIVDYLIDIEDCKLVVVACNTATAAAAKTLRAERPETPIIGMEPAVKPAAAATRTGVIGVMATAGTIASDKYAALLDQYGEGARVVEDDCAGLVQLIEDGHVEDEQVRARLEQIVVPMVGAGADMIVLGCTHFPVVEAEIRALAGPGVELIDPAPAVARQVGRVLRESGMAAVGAGSGREEVRARLLTSGEPEALRMAAGRVLGGEWVVDRWGGD